MKRIIVFVLAAVLGMPGLVLAQGGPDGQGGPQGPPGDVPRGQFPIKDPACVADCRAELSACVEDAREVSIPCLTPCEAKQAEVRTACQAAPRSEECRQARIEAQQCVRACWDELRPILAECVGDARECIGACPVIEDRECLESCVQARRGCTFDVGQQTRECRHECGAAIQTAQQTCRGGRGSQLCQAANGLARECLGECGELAREGLQLCASEWEACVSPCAGGEEVPPQP